MLDRNTLKAAIVKKELSQKAVATELGVTPKTFYSKMSRGVFDSDEIYLMAELLDLENPWDIFFANPVT